ncbi:MAG: transglutaminase-like cysteine peptidase [Pseudomonadota bacterium]
MSRSYHYHYGLFIIIAFLVGSHNAHALSSSQLKEAFQAPQSSTLAEGGAAVAPFGHVAFCQTHPQECRSRGHHSSVKAKKGQVVMTKQRWRELTRVNSSINRRIIARTDQQQHGREELWSLASRYGDCEDYVLLKRQKLMRMGWPSRALRIAVVVTRQGEVHAVLVARTTQGDYVLDNLASRVKPWQRTGLRWVKLQAGRNPRSWVSVSGRSIHKSAKRKGYKNDKSHKRSSQLRHRKVRFKGKSSAKSWNRVSTAKKNKLASFFNSDS